MKYDTTVLSISFPPSHNPSLFLFQFKQLDVEDPRRSPFMNKKMVTEIYLPRMLSTKVHWTHTHTYTPLTTHTHTHTHTHSTHHTHADIHTHTHADIHTHTLHSPHMLIFIGTSLPTCTHTTPLTSPPTHTHTPLTEHPPEVC